MTGVDLSAWDDQRRTLCAWLYDRDLIPPNADGIHDWTVDHQTIAIALIALKRDGQPTDFITVSDGIRRLAAQYVVEELSQEGPAAWHFIHGIMDTLEILPTLLDPALLKPNPTA